MSNSIVETSIPDMPVWEGTKEGQQRPEGHVVRLNELVRFDPSTTRNAELEAEEQMIFHYIAKLPITMLE